MSYDTKCVGESTLRGDDLPKRGEKPLKEVNPRKKIIGGKI